MIGVLDVGYDSVKAIGGEDRRVTFPSVVGTPETARISLNGSDARTIILLQPSHVSVGSEAVSQSRFLTRLEDRDWITTDVWYSLAMAALSEITAATLVELDLVAGLPVSFFNEQHTLVRDRLLGEHRVQRKDRRAQVFRVKNIRVITQPMGTFLASVMDKSGRIIDESLAKGPVGVVDVGGKTTNLSMIEGLTENSQSFSINAGGWDVMRYVRDWLSNECPKLDLRDTEVAQAIKDQQVGYFDEIISLASPIHVAATALADQITGAATQLWNGGAGLRAILVTGGGAHLVGKHLCRKWRHARVVDDPVFANVSGYWKLARRVWGV